MEIKQFQKPFPTKETRSPSYSRVAAIMTTLPWLIYWVLLSCHGASSFFAGVSLPKSGSDTPM